MYLVANNSVAEAIALWCVVMKQRELKGAQRAVLLLVTVYLGMQRAAQQAKTVLYF